MKTIQLSVIFLSSVYILKCLASPKTYIIETDDGDDDENEILRGRIPQPPIPA